MKSIKIFLLLIIIPVSVFSQLLKPSNSINSSITGVNSEPDLFYNVSLTSFQMLTASLRIDKQKLVFSPLKLLEKWHDPLSTLKMNLAQENNITTFGIGINFGETPSNSEKAKKVLNEIHNKLDKCYYKIIVIDTNKTKREQYLIDSIYIPYWENLLKKINLYLH